MKKLIIGILIVFYFSSSASASIDSEIDKQAKLDWCGQNFKHIENSDTAKMMGVLYSQTAMEDYVKLAANTDEDISLKLAERKEFYRIKSDSEQGKKGLYQECIKAIKIKM